MKTYIKPEITIFMTSVNNIIANSYNNYSDCTCTKLCKYWHLCRDRQEGKFCSDKEL